MPSTLDILEEQFTFNKVVADKLEEAESHLTWAAHTIVEEPAKDALEKARAAIKGGKG